MDIPSLVIPTLTTAALAILGWFGRDKLTKLEATVNDLEDELEETKDELQLLTIQVTKAESKAEELSKVMAKLDVRFDRLEDKIDQLIRNPHNQ